MAAGEARVVLAWVATYLVACLVVGAWALRRIHDRRDFFVAGRNLGFVVTGMAMFSSTLSGFGFVGGPGLIYAMGASSVWIIVTTPPGMAISTWLLAIAKHGVIYAPGSAGTIQEIFQDAAQNHYGTFEMASPMVFFGRRYWTEEKPVYPLLEGLAAGRQYGDLLTITDDVDEVVDFIATHPPVVYEG